MSHQPALNPTLQKLLEESTRQPLTRAQLDLLGCLQQAAIVAAAAFLQAFTTCMAGGSLPPPNPVQPGTSHTTA